MNTMRVSAAVTVAAVLLSTTVAQSVLYPRSSESRDVVSLDGIWDFSLSPPEYSGSGFIVELLEKSLRDASPSTHPMPVPASYNDITVDKSIRDHVGVVWYQRKFFVPASWSSGQKVWIRFGSVCYSAQVWVNGKLVTSHDIGHLPFQAEVTSAVNFGAENLITVAVDNTLLDTTIPQGSLGELHIGNETYVTQDYTFDFFNYAGIDRSVYLFATPAIFISDINTSTQVSEDNSNASVVYSIEYTGSSEGSIVSCQLTLEDNGEVVVTANDCSGTIPVQNPKLWWPYLMDPNPGYLYTLKVELNADGIIDVYRQSIGIRSITWTNSSVLINGKPIYIRGFGRHEDSIIKGKGLDLSLIARDYNLIKWVGANTFRTSHYPYAEEIMDFADQQGIMIIDECPSVNTDIFTEELKENHKRSITEMITRDKNRPSVIMWSVANEPYNQKNESEAYFRDIVAHTKTLDTSRPLTIATAKTNLEDHSAQFLDVVSFNRYNGWYTDSGRTQVITEYVVEQAEGFRQTFQKPILMTEYGADTYPGLHAVPDIMWSEEYQNEVMNQHFKAFDILRSRGYFIGEMIWNYADFMTSENSVLAITRVGGNRKGIFTRERYPKSSAHLLRQRYWSLAEELDNVSPPRSYYDYTRKNVKTEL